MKSIIFAALSLCGLAASSSLPHVEAPTHQFVRRDVGVIEEGLYNISNSTVSLTQQIRNFKLSNLFALQTANTEAVATIKTATEKIKMTDPITLQDALVLTPIITMLVKTTQDSVNVTIGQKETFGGLVPVVKANLMQQLQASQQLNLAIGTKLPSNLLSISAQQSAPIYQSLNAGIKEFSTAVPNTPQNSPELFGRMRSAGVSLTALTQAVLAGGLVAIVAALQSL